MLTIQSETVKFSDSGQGAPATYTKRITSGLQKISGPGCFAGDTVQAELVTPLDFTGWCRLVVFVVVVNIALIECGFSQRGGCVRRDELWSSDNQQTTSEDGQS